MCGIEEYKPTAKEASVSLASLLKNKLDCHVDAVALRLFIQVHWSSVRKYAHAIHEDR